MRIRSTYTQRILVLQPTAMIIGTVLTSCAESLVVLLMLHAALLPLQLQTKYLRFLCEDQECFGAKTPMLVNRQHGWLASRAAMPVQTVLQHMCVLLPAYTAANTSKSSLLLAQVHQCWQTGCMAGRQARLLMLVQTVLLHLHA